MGDRIGCGAAALRCGVVGGHSFLVAAMAPSPVSQGFVVSLRAPAAAGNVAVVGNTDQEGQDMTEDLNITAAQDAADAEALDAALPDEARGHYATADDADAAAADYVAHPPVWPHFIDG